jgi:nucleotide-binding universal stress UspA family protein
MGIINKRRVFNMKKILVATDGSKYSQKALFKAKQIATDMGLEVTVVSIVTLYDNVYSHNQAIKSELGKAEMERSKNVLKEAEEIFSDFQGKFSTIYKTGDVVDQIIKLAEEGDYDLLIMGSRGLGAFSRTLLGSVSDKVIHHVKTSVMLVK